jgi:hypothetical protein
MIFRSLLQSAYDIEATVLAASLSDRRWPKPSA